MRRPRVRTMISVGATATVLALLLWFGTSRAGDDVPADPQSASRAASAAAAPLRPTMAVPPAKPIPAEYGPLLTRTIFGRPAPAAPAADKRKKHSDPPAPEAVLVLRGVTVQANRVVALIEDVDAKQVMKVEVGGAVGGGRLTEVGFEGVRFVADGSPARRVPIGCSLDGAAAAPVPVAVPAKAKLKAGEGREGRDAERKKGQAAAAASN